MTVSYEGSFDLTNTMVPNGVQRTRCSSTSRAVGSTSGRSRHAEGELLWRRTAFPTRRASTRSQSPAACTQPWRDSPGGPELMCALRIVPVTDDFPDFLASYDAANGSLKISGLSSGAVRYGRFYVGKRDPMRGGGPGHRYVQHPRELELRAGALIDDAEHPDGRGASVRQGLALDAQVRLRGSGASTSRRCTRSCRSASSPAASTGQSSRLRERATASEALEGRHRPSSLRRARAPTKPRRRVRPSASAAPDRSSSRPASAPPSSSSPATRSRSPVSPARAPLAARLPAWLLSGGADGAHDVAGMDGAVRDVLPRGGERRRVGAAVRLPPRRQASPPSPPHLPARPGTRASRNRTPRASPRSDSRRPSPRCRTTSGSGAGRGASPSGSRARAPSP